MAQEADFYSAEEAAKVLGIPVRRVFGMLCDGELEGYQDEWARWRVPASAVRHVRRDPEPTTSDPLGASEDTVESRSTEGEARVEDAATTIVSSDGGPLWSSPSLADSSSGEETTQEVGEAPVSDGSGSYALTQGDDAEVTKLLPRGDHPEMAEPDSASNEIIRELAERLAEASAKTRELRDRLELAEVTEAALRENLERERQRADRESAQTKLQRGADEQFEERQSTEPGEGFWRRFLGG
jgi:hypothetical protein